MIINQSNHHQHQELWKRTLARLGRSTKNHNKRGEKKAKKKCSGEKKITEQERELRRQVEMEERKEVEIIPLHASDMNPSFPLPEFTFTLTSRHFALRCLPLLPGFLHVMFSATTELPLPAWGEGGGSREQSWVQKGEQKLLLLLY